MKRLDAWRLTLVTDPTYKNDEYRFWSQLTALGFEVDLIDMKSNYITGYWTGATLNDRGRKQIDLQPLEKVRGVAQVHVRGEAMRAAS